ncbi:tyrosine phosphatase family protein [Magnetospirillum sp. UT-4]|uniref:tyrosine phosphatase family protein n=1 Tax=Magnetospirillum sp. UT-4 TaxID=2681467 RepID=UPI0015732FCA|nr:protein-tyrosine-phosphatase [Magnetospirillum sp. UT-4]
MTADPTALAVCGHYEINQTVWDFAATHMILITDPESTGPDSPAGVTMLRLEFHDVTALTDVTSLALQGGVVLPTREHVLAALTFAAEMPAEARLLVTCGAGISRSTAIALTLLAQAMPGREADAVTRLHRIRSGARPNPLIVQYADDALGLGGRLVGAICGLG